MGATTIWERWDSMLADGSINPGQMTSFNHYALGAVADWLHRKVAGLAPLEPAYRTIHIAPTLLPDLNNAATWHETPYGTASAAWHREGDKVHFHAEIPPDTTAQVTLPSGATYNIGSGTHTWTEHHPRPTQTRAPLTLSSSLTDIIDDLEAYQAVLAAIRTTRWTPGRQLREPLNKAPLPVLEAIEKALAALRGTAGP